MTDSTNLRISQAEPAHTAACLSEDEVLAFAMGRLDVRRVSRLHEHLDSCEDCQFLVSDGVHGLANAVTMPLGSAGVLAGMVGNDVAFGAKTTFRVGSLVGGRYRIDRFIIDGGMGEVYEAFDCDLQERVALKTVKATVSDHPRAVRWLKGEVQLARRVSHPNVCRIYDFGSHTMPETGVVISFLTMEFVEGETLGLRVRLCGALPAEEARTLARQLLLGLSAAHEAGVLHRDFKSDNVMLRDEANDRTSPVILDFGLARPLNSEAKSSSSALVGTFGYIAPEQLEGKPHTRASDLYSFGVVWYEMLTGELPFGDDGYAAEAVLSPSARNSLVPKELDAVVLKCIRRLPRERFKSAEEVLHALDAIRPAKLGARGAVGIAAAAALATLAVFYVFSVALRSSTPRAIALNPALPALTAAPAFPSAESVLKAAIVPTPVVLEEAAARARPDAAPPKKRGALANPAPRPSASVAPLPAPPTTSSAPPPAASSKQKPTLPVWEPF